MMMNSVGIFNLFGENKKAKKLFLEWCKNCEEFCDADIENLESDLLLPHIDNSEQYFHFHNGNILDFLESEGLYIGLPFNEKSGFSAVLHSGNGVTYTYSDTNGLSRTKALEIGVQRAIDKLEERL